MKPIYLACIFLLISFNCWANKIDELKTDKDVERFVMSLDTFFTRRPKPVFHVWSTDTLWAKSKRAAVNKIKNWEKTDFNNDGRTDLLVTAEWHGIETYAVIDQGSDKFKLVRLSSFSFGEPSVAKIIPAKKQPLLYYYTVRRFPEPGKSSLYSIGIDSNVVDTLIYKFGHFVNLETKPGGKRVRSITCDIHPTWSTAYKVSIDKNGIAKYYDDYRITKEGKLTAKVDPVKLKNLYDLIAYMDMKNIKDSYYVDAFDLTTAYLTIEFTDGTKKSIKDYGMTDRWDLSAIYTMFREIFLSFPNTSLR